MEDSEPKNVETGGNDQAIATQMEASDRRDLTLEQIIALNKEDSNENLCDETKNNDDERDEFKDYL